MEWSLGGVGINVTDLERSRSPFHDGELAVQARAGVLEKAAGIGTMIQEAFSEAEIADQIRYGGR